MQRCFFYLLFICKLFSFLANVVVFINKLIFSKMNLNCETILDLYTYKNKKILCRNKLIHSQSYNEFRNSFRYLTLDQWNKFDKELGNLMSNIDIWKDDRNHEFKINSYIEVKVEKSKLSLKKFNKCLGALNEFHKHEDNDEVEEADYILECLFYINSEDQIHSPIYKAEEYNPESSIDNSLSYVPYTPSKKKYRVDSADTIKTPGIGYLIDNEPEYLSEISKDDALFLKKATTDKPVSNESTRRSSRESNKSSKSDLLNEVIVETDYETEFHQKCISSTSNQGSEYIPETQELLTAEKDNKRHKTRKRSNTVDEISALSGAKTKEKKRHSEKKEINKRSKSIDEIQSYKLKKFKNILTEENNNKSLEPIEENKTYKEATKTKLNTIETASITKHKTNSKKKESSPSLSSDDEKFYIKEKSKIKTSKTHTKTSDDEIKSDNKLNKNLQLKESNGNGSNLNISILSATESATGTSPLKHRRERKPKENNNDNVIKSVRRSERSPIKPRRFIEEQPDLLKTGNKTKHKNSVTNKELFGTDEDDEDEYFEKTKNNKETNKVRLSSVFETPVGKKPPKSLTSSSSSSSKKKRKRDRSAECQQEKRDMNKWLSKKKSSTKDKEIGKTTKEKSKSTSSSTSSSSSRSLPLKSAKKEKSLNADVGTESRSNSPKPVFEMPSKEELESIRNDSKLKQKENEKIKAELEKMRRSPPKEVQTLSLLNIPMNDILDTFSTYKSDLDKIYENNRKKDYIKGHDGINHCFVIKLLQQNIQMKMLEKLTEIYSDTKNTTQATLFANALLPEWIMRVYMKEHNFTRQEAINQIQAQEEFQLHLEEQNDNSFMFD
ncbi:uncharacterized protein ACRADG_006313 [Cochliomyia hominivorax]